MYNNTPYLQYFNVMYHVVPK